MISIESTLGAETTAATVPEPLVVRPRDACRLLACGNTHLYQLLGTGELESYRDGRGRRITLQSIRRYVTRRLAAAGIGTVQTQPRRRGRPRKNDSKAAVP